MSHSVRILIISDRGGGGGAGIISARQGEALVRLGHEIVGFCRAQSQYPSTSVHYQFKGTPRPKGLPIIGRIHLPHADPDAWRKDFQRVLDSTKPNIISIHNLHGGPWPVEAVSFCLDHAPVVWTLHDMWAITGSCAFTYDCRRFAEGNCDEACPQLDGETTVAPGQISEELNKRRELYNSANGLTVVAPSRWLRKEAKTFIQDAVPVRQLSYGLNTDIYYPVSKPFAREMLGIPDDDRINIITVADSHSNPRKGLDLLQAALWKFEHARFRILMLGRPAKERLKSSQHTEWHSLGLIPQGGTQALAYSAADLMIHPSRADNQPLVVQEAMACGLPVVAFNVGGVPEMVLEGKTGWIAKTLDPEGLAAALQRAIDSRSDWHHIGPRGRELVIERYAIELFGRRYEALFRAILEGRILSQDELDNVR